MRNSLVQSKHRGLIYRPTVRSHSNCWDALFCTTLWKVYNVARLCYRHEYVANLKWVVFNPVWTNQYLRCFTYIDDLKEQSLKYSRKYQTLKNQLYEIVYFVLNLKTYVTSIWKFIYITITCRYLFAIYFAFV